jgi:hypothetical protein
VRKKVQRFSFLQTSDSFSRSHISPAKCQMVNAGRNRARTACVLTDRGPPHGEKPFMKADRWLEWIGWGRRADELLAWL